MKVPVLPYAPQRETPLSLSRPRDYFTLLYWVFYFPQALRWYSETFSSAATDTAPANALVQDRIQRRLALQGGILVVVSSCMSAPALAFSAAIFEITVLQGSFDFYSYLTESAGATVGVVLLIILLSIVIGVVLGFIEGIAGGVATAVAVSTAIPIAIVLITPFLTLLSGLNYRVADFLSSHVLGLTAQQASDLYFDHSSAVSLFVDIGGGTQGGLQGGIPLGIVVGLGFGAFRGVKAGAGWGGLKDVSTSPRGIILLFLTLALLGLVFISALVSATEGYEGLVAFTVGLSTILGVAVSVGLMRPDVVLITNLRAWLRRNRKGQPPMQRCSSVPIPGLQSHLVKQLVTDWAQGLAECEGLLRYSLQFKPVIRALEAYLKQTPVDLLLPHLSVWCNLPPYDWVILRALSSGSLSSKLRYDTPIRSAAAGFWHLRQRQVSLAVQAFTTVRPLPYGNELADNAVALDRANRCHSLPDIAAWPLPAAPAGRELLRPQVREIFSGLGQIALEIGLVVRAVSPQQRNSAFIRAQAMLNDLPRQIMATPAPEARLLMQIVRQWLKVVTDSANEVTNVEVRELVTSPYIVGAIVPASRLAGRDDIFAQIQSMWSKPGQRDSLVIYGHRRMGKSSLIRSLTARCDFGADTGLAVRNLQSVDWDQGLRDLCYIVAVQLWEALPTSLAEPDPADYQDHPLIAFRNLLEQLHRHHPEHRYILVLDEFELLDQNLSSALANELVTKLRGFTQDYPWLVMALVGLHTLQERSADFYQAIYAWRPIKVGLFAAGGTADALQVEDAAFPLEYSPEALAQIHQLTGGQPFLVQLLGDSLVQLFNARLRVDLQPPAATFTAEDVGAVVADPVLYQQGNVYFRGLWEQTGETPGQQVILHALAPVEEGLSVAALRRTSNVPSAVFDAALQALIDHDVLVCTDSGCRYTVELMRRWVAQQVTSTRQ